MAFADCCVKSYRRPDPHETPGAGSGCGDSSSGAPPSSGNGSNLAGVRPPGQARSRIIPLSESSLPDGKSKRPASHGPAPPDRIQQQILPPLRAARISFVSLAGARGPHTSMDRWSLSALVRRRGPRCRSRECPGRDRSYERGHYRSQCDAELPRPAPVDGFIHNECPRPSRFRTHPCRRRCWSSELRFTPPECRPLSSHAPHPAVLRANRHRAGLRG